MNNFKNKVKEIFAGWTKFDIIWLIVANLVILGCSIYFGDSLVSIISAMTGITCVILVSKQMVANYIFGAVNVVLYGCLAYKSRLYGDFMLNFFYYLPTNIIGFFMWKKLKEQGGEIKARALTNKQRVVLAIVCIIGILGYSFILQMLGGSIPLIDSMSTVLSVVAMILMMKCFKEQWILWILVNGVSVVMWFITLRSGSGNIATILMWCVYLLNSIFGYINWNKSSKN